MIVEDSSLRDRVGVFSSRQHAGSLLSRYVAKEEFDLLLIIPNGGLPIGLGLFESPLIRKTPVDLLIVRKIQIPWSTEAGMGAITPDGQIFVYLFKVAQTLEIREHIIVMNIQTTADIRNINKS